MFASSMGQLPLQEGTDMTDELKKELGIRSLKVMEREVDEVDDKLQRDLLKPRPNLPPCKKP